MAMISSGSPCPSSSSLLSASDSYKSSILSLVLSSPVNSILCRPLKPILTAGRLEDHRLCLGDQHRRTQRRHPWHPSKASSGDHLCNERDEQDGLVMVQGTNLRTSSAAPPAPPTPMTSASNNEGLHSLSPKVPVDVGGLLRDADIPSQPTTSTGVGAAVAPPGPAIAMAGAAQAEISSSIVSQFATVPGYLGPMQHCRKVGEPCGNEGRVFEATGGAAAASSGRANIGSFCTDGAPEVLDNMPHPTESSWTPIVASEDCLDASHDLSSGPVRLLEPSSSFPTEAPSSVAARSIAQWRPEWGNFHILTSVRVAVDGNTGPRSASHVWIEALRTKSFHSRDITSF